MRTLLWTLGWIGVGVWTLFSLGAFAVLGLFGELGRGVGGYVEGFPVETLSPPWIVNMVQSVGGAAIFLVWAGGVAMILAVPAIASLFLRRRDDRRRRPNDYSEAEYARQQGGTIDRSSPSAVQVDKLLRRPR
jgi:hypothetical protein